MSNTGLQKPFDGMPISRRLLLRRGAGLAAVGLTPAVLAACGGGSSSTGGGTSSSSSTGGSASAGTVGGSVGFIGYEGLYFPEVLKSFYKQHGIKVNPSLIGSMSEIPPKFAAGGGEGIDIVNYSAPGNQRLQESGVEFAPLELDRLPNWKYVENFVELTGKENFSNVEGEIVAIPLAWGSLGINYNSGLIPEPKSWAELRDPKFKGKLSTIDDPSTNVDVTAEILGFRANEMTKDQFQEVLDFLEGIIANCKTLSTTYGDLTNLFAAEEIEAAYGSWSAINVFAAEAGNSKIKTNVEPKEGGGVFVEQWGLAADAENPDTVYAIMNQVLDPKVNGEAATAVLCAATAEGAQKYQPKSIISLYKPESEYEKYFSQNSVSIDAPAQSDQFVTFGEVTEAWVQLKAGA